MIRGFWAVEERQGINSSKSHNLVERSDLGKEAQSFGIMMMTVVAGCSTSSVDRYFTGLQSCRGQSLVTVNHRQGTTMP